MYTAASSWRLVYGKAAGRQFVLAFPQHRCRGCPSPAARLYVTSCSRRGPVDVVVNLPGQARGLLWPTLLAPPFTRSSHRLLNNGDSVEFELPSPVHLDGTSVENKGLLHILQLYVSLVIRTK